MENICWFKEQTVIRGKHAKYVRQLKEKKIFERVYDAYIQCALYGVCSDLKSETDLNTNEQPQNIFANVFYNDSDYCLRALRLVILLDKSLNLSKEEKIRRIFSFKNGTYEEEKADEMKENILLFNKYFYGGIEDIYSRYFKNCINDDDNIDKMKTLIEEFYLLKIKFDEKEFLKKISD